VSSIYIRGLSSDTPGAQFMGTVGVQPNVALYLNDAPSSMPGRNLDIYPVDLNRVEVLAGPQGTLFGASSMGGAIRYITSKPDLTRWGGDQRLGLGDLQRGDERRGRWLYQHPDRQGQAGPARHRLF
jgi:outer membrane receptor protein involved in Fe transport